MPIELLCHFDGTSGSTTFVDAYGHTMTAGGSAVINTTSPKFGTGRGDFTGTAPRISVGTPTDFDLGAGQFTIEAWGYYLTWPPPNSWIAAKWSGATYGWGFGVIADSLAFWYSTTGSDALNVASGGLLPTVNTWNHFAVDRDASNMVRLYMNGAVVASGTVAATIMTSPSHCVIGNDDSNGNPMTGYLDEMRITVGLAQYAGAFTPQTAPFADPGGTVAQARAVVMA